MNLEMNMEMNLLLTAKQLTLSPGLTKGSVSGGVLMVKNERNRTYLAVTPQQWQLLQRFSTPHTVPKMLEAGIVGRYCLPLGEYYELVLKAVQAKILLEGTEPDEYSGPVSALNWGPALQPTRWRTVLHVFMGLGLAGTLAGISQGGLPLTILAASGSLGAALLTAVLGVALAATFLRGAGGEVYRSPYHWLDRRDLCMLPAVDQSTILLTPATLMATTTGVLTWFAPAYSFFPLLLLMWQLRPLRGNVNRSIRAAARHQVSAAEHDFLFPLNRTPQKRWQALGRGLHNPATWLEVAHGVVWTLVASYCIGALTGTPLWSLAFWQTRGLWLLGTLTVALLALGAGYFIVEAYLFLHERAIARHETLRQVKRRWFQAGKLATDVAARIPVFARVALFRQLEPDIREKFAAHSQPLKVGPWQALTAEGACTHFSVILSGKVGVYRTNLSGRRVLFQVLSEDDVVGFHDTNGAMGQSQVFYRTLTPVVRLQLGWGEKQALQARISPELLCTLVYKMPFLVRTPLCQNWHIQSVRRFAELATLSDFSPGTAIVAEGKYSEWFYLLVGGEAKVTRRSRKFKHMRAGDFFGEIGLLQNSAAVAQVTAGSDAQALCIPRETFLRFVTHNYAVAMELERVSSQRLGQPIFPLGQDHFNAVYRGLSTAQ